MSGAPTPDFPALTVDLYRRFLSALSAAGRSPEESFAASVCLRNAVADVFGWEPLELARRADVLSSDPPPLVAVSGPEAWLLQTVCDAVYYRLADDLAASVVASVTDSVTAAAAVGRDSGGGETTSPERN